MMTWWIALLLDSGVAAAISSPRGGAVEVVDELGALHELPLLHTDMEARVDGDLASVALVQTFANPYDEPMSARYVFPLPEDAAVHAMRLEAGGLVIEGEIQRKSEAEATFAEAKAEGKQAALLTQDRPNVFVQQVANLPPGAQVRVEIHYAHAIDQRDGAYELVFPMVVGPRYEPDAPRVPDAAPLGTFVAQPPLATPETIDPDRVSVRVSLDGGVPIRGITSPSHALHTEQDGPRYATISLESGRTIDNRDFVLRYTLAAETTGVGVVAHGADGAGVVGLHIQPPNTPPNGVVVPRELVFVLDTSGSMCGQPLQSSQLFMQEALKTLGPADSFRLVQFSQAASAMSTEAVPATPANLRRGRDWVEALACGGGTEVISGIEAAFGPPIEPGVLRIVVLLTDGYIGNETEVIRAVERTRGEARIFALGIGSSVNRWLLEELAREGRGVARVVLDPSMADEAARRLAERLAAPVLTDLRIQWGQAPVADVSPAVLPDLFAGEPVRVLARYQGTGRWPIRVQGRLNGEVVTLALDLALPEEAPGGDALPIVWARAQIEDRMQAWARSGDDAERQRLAEEITALGLEHHLLTQWTAFVAVAKQLAVASTPGREVDVAAPAPAGVPPTAFGFSGSAAPEPAFWLSVGLLLALAALALRRPPIPR